MAFSTIDKIMERVNEEYFAVFPYDSNEYNHVKDGLPWNNISESTGTTIKVTVLQLGNTIATVIDDGTHITVKDSHQWYFYIDDYGKENGDNSFGFGVYPENNKEHNEYGFCLCRQTYDLDPGFDEAAEMYIEIDHNKYKTKDDLISYLQGKGLIYDANFNVNYDW